MIKPVTAYVALGSNLGEPAKQLARALEILAQSSQTTLVQCSPVYGSLAIGPGDQPDYCNAVAELETSLSPLHLLDRLLEIESLQGRVRAERWAARTLDLDLLYYNALTLDSERLTLPHPRMLERNFVLFPLRDIAPDLVIANDKTVSEHALRLSAVGLQRLEY